MRYENNTRRKKMKPSMMVSYLFIDFLYIKKENNHFLEHLDMF